MTRCRTWTAIFALLIVATALPLVVAPPKAEAAPLRARLVHAKLHLQRVRHHLAIARTKLHIALSVESALADSAATATEPAATATESAATATDSAAVATQTLTPQAAAQDVSAWRTRVVRWRVLTKRSQRQVARLARAYRLQRSLAIWERQGNWSPIIRVAAAKYHVSAAGIYRMMMRESGGDRYAGSQHAFKGLFQYYPGTWSASWNPWRGDSIYDGSSQIFATCYAVHKGYGPSMWTSTYAYAF